MRLGGDFQKFISIFWKQYNRFDLEIIVRAIEDCGGYLGNRGESCDRRYGLYRDILLLWTQRSIGFSICLND